MTFVITTSARLKKCDLMKQNQQRLLHIMGKVSRNDVTESIRNILDAVERHLGAMPNEQEAIYSMTLDKVKGSNEKLWFTISLRLGKIYLEAKKIKELEALLKALK